MEKQGESGPCVTFPYYFAKAFGLAPFSLENNIVSHGSFWDKLWPSVVLVIYAFLQSAVILQRLNVDDGIESELTQTGDLLAFQVELIVIVISVITVWYKKDDIIEIAQSFIMIKKMLKRLGIQQDYEKKFRRYAIFLGLSSCVVIFLGIQMDLIFMYVKNYAITPLSIITTTGGSVNSLVYHFMIFNFVSIMMLTEECYAKLNCVLSNVLYVQEINSNNHRGLRRLCTSQIQPSNIALANEPMHFDSETLSDEELKPSQKLIKIQDLHHELHDMTGKIVDLFSFPLLGVIGFYFTSITTNFFYLYAGLSSRVNYFGIVEVLSSTVLMSLFAVELCAIAVVCSSTQNTGNSTATILRKIWIQHRPVQMIDEIQMLSLQLLQRPLTISAFGFFSLDYSYLYKIFCAVVAYFVIMVQLDTSKLEAAQNVSTLAPNVTGMH